ncbi:hypothetical protein, partial [Vibrio cyclitrophicus]|uniref:hypothetical protein n=1 Tax=Vibrio cyclitrophicus TaxID=47951 RepID=UPI001A7E08D6
VNRSESATNLQGDFGAQSISYRVCKSPLRTIEGFWWLFLIANSRIYPHRNIAYQKNCTNKVEFYQK